MNTSPRNILVLLIAGLEETVLALPALRSLRSHLPRSRITVVTSRIGAELLEMAGGIDRILSVGRFRHGEIFNPASLYRSYGVIEELKRSPYDLAIELEPGTESTFILSASRTPEQLRAGRNAAPGAIIERISEMLSNRPPQQRHKAHEYLKCLEPLGVRPVEPEPRIKTVRESDEAIDRLLQKQGVQAGELMVGIHPGAGTSALRWPAGRFTSVATRMVHNFGARIVVFAGPHERSLGRRIARELPPKSSFVIRTPKLVDFISAAARLSLLIANHSGPAQLAAAVGTPVVVASVSSGPSDHDILGSRVEHIRAPHIEMVPEEEIFEAACRLLKINRAKFLGER